MSELPRYQAALFKLFFWIGLSELARFWNRNKVTILCYHGITARATPDPTDRSAIAVRHDLFRAQLRYIEKHYKVISLREYLTLRTAGQSVPRYSLVLTFDDGLRNFLTVATPILKEFGFPATMYLVTDNVNARADSRLSSGWTLADDRVSLSWPEVKALQSTHLVEFGSHTCSHPQLEELSVRAADELDSSLKAIRENLPEAGAISFAYPYGYHSANLIGCARAVGYSCALTTEPGSNSLDTDLFLLRRAVVRSYDTLEMFTARVSGVVGWLRMLRHTFRNLTSSFKQSEFGLGAILTMLLGYKPTPSVSRLFCNARQRPPLQPE